MLKLRKFSFQIGTERGAQVQKRKSPSANAGAWVLMARGGVDQVSAGEFLGFIPQTMLFDFRE